jgi:heat shock protein HtpX
MDRFKVSTLEANLLLSGLILVLVGAGASALASGAGDLRRVVGTAGLVVLVMCAGSRGVRLYRAGTAAALPTAVGHVRIRPARGFAVVAVTIALVLPLAAAVAVLVVVEWAWLPLALVLLVGICAVVATREDDDSEPLSAPDESELLARLCMRADMTVPELVVEPGLVANAWTSGGRIHVTRPLLRLLDRSELEAVLAHELAHLARRDAAVMEICSAPSRVLLAFSGVTTPRIARLTVDTAGLSPSLAVLIAFLAALCIPPAFVIGWLSRLSVLGASRARELAADATAATLTGRPSALASALLKLEGCSMPSADLRRVDALCIVGAGRWRLFSTHPSTAVRVQRLEALETRLNLRRTASR